MSEAAPIALITGAARRIGRAIALDRGARLGRCGPLPALPRGGGGAGGRNRRARRAALRCPATSPIPRRSRASCRDAPALGAPTCLVNNASEFQIDTVATTSPESWDTHLDINLKAPVFLARSLFLHLPPETTGNVINIIDQRVWKLTPDFFSYTISKAG